MKNLFFLIALGILTGVTGCSQSPESHCEEGMDHLSKLMQKDPSYALMIAVGAGGPEVLEAKKKEATKECVAKYDKDGLKDVMDCVLKAETKAEAARCEK